MGLVCMAFLVNVVVVWFTKIVSFVRVMCRCVEVVMGVAIMRFTMIIMRMLDSAVNVIALPVRMLVAIMGVFVATVRVFVALMSVSVALMRVTVAMMCMTKSEHSD